MTRIIHFIPGLLAAITAYLGLQLMHLIGIRPLFEFLFFLIIYLAIAYLAERAIKTYAEKNL